MSVTECKTLTASNSPSPPLVPSFPAVRFAARMRSTTVDGPSDKSKAAAPDACDSSASVLGCNPPPSPPPPPLLLLSADATLLTTSTGVDEAVVSMSMPTVSRGRTAHTSAGAGSGPLRAHTSTRASRGDSRTATPPPATPRCAEGTLALNTGQNRCDCLAPVTAVSPAFPCSSSSCVGASFRERGQVPRCNSANEVGLSGGASISASGTRHDAAVCTYGATSSEVAEIVRRRLCDWFLAPKTK